MLLQMGGNKISQASFLKASSRIFVESRRSLLTPVFWWMCWDGNKIQVVQLTSTRGHCLTFNPTFPPLQVALSFACSVASLSLCLSFQLPGWHSLHYVILADYLLGWGRVSTCWTGHDGLHCTPRTMPEWQKELPARILQDSFSRKLEQLWSLPFIFLENCWIIIIQSIKKTLVVYSTWFNKPNM